MDDDPESQPAVLGDDRGHSNLDIEEAYDMMFGPGAFRWAEEQALRRLRHTQAAAVAEAESLLRSAGRGMG